MKKTLKTQCKKENVNVSDLPDFFYLGFHINYCFDLISTYSFNCHEDFFFFKRKYTM